MALTFKSGEHANFIKLAKQLKNTPFDGLPLDALSFLKQATHTHRNGRHSRKYDCFPQ